MYDHRKQLKCAIIRARAISDVDNLLPKYATVIDNLCPCTKAEFEKGFNDAFREYAISKARNKSNESAIKKTLDNHLFNIVTYIRICKKKRCCIIKTGIRVLYFQFGRRT